MPDHYLALETFAPSRWDVRFLRIATEIARWSKDRSTQVGAVLVDEQRRILGTGYNGFPQGVEDDVEERHARPAKYLYTEHAERNAVYTAAAHGVPLAGCSLYVTHPPCADCARAVIQTRLRRVVAYHRPIVGWEASFTAARAMMHDAGIALVLVNPTVEGKPRVVVESPLAGDFVRNARYARYAMRDALLRGEAPFLSHALYTQCLDDTAPEERALGMAAALAWYETAHHAAVYVDLGVSDGMRKGIAAHVAAGRMVVERCLCAEDFAAFERGDDARCTLGFEVRP